MSTYLEQLRDAARQKNREAAIKAIHAQHGDTETANLAFLNGKSDDYIFARLDAMARGVEEQAARRSDAGTYGGRPYREDAEQAPQPGPYGRHGYAHLDGGDHSGAEAEGAAYRASVARLNADRTEGGGKVITAAEKAKAGEAKGAEFGEPDEDEKRRERVEATNAEARLTDAEARANEALAKANERLNAARKPQHAAGVFPERASKEDK
jgi:hypothetical protein